jgi:hypothetical protein
MGKEEGRGKRGKWMEEGRKKGTGGQHTFHAIPRHVGNSEYSNYYLRIT